MTILQSSMKSIIKGICFVSVVLFYMCKPSPNTGENRTVCYYWNHDTDSFSHSYYEDVIIELEFKGDYIVAGHSWTNSDEIDDAREGYSVGGCIVPLSSIVQMGDTLFYSIDYRKVVFLSDGVEYGIYSTEQAINKGYKVWCNNEWFPNRSRRNEFIINYRCIVTDSTLFVTTLTPYGHGMDSFRIFNMKEKSVIRNIDRRIPKRYHDIN